MAGRALLGLFKGALLGGALVAALVFGLKVSAVGAVLAYVLAVFAGLVTGLVAGKPIWRAGAIVEAGLKAVFGAAAGAGFLWLLLRYVQSHLPAALLTMGGATPSGDVSVLLPALAVLPIALLLQLDDTPAPEGAEAPRVRVKAGSGADAKKGAAADEGDDELDADVAPRSRAKR